VLVHIWRLLRLRLLRFRLETFGLYFPSLPHSQPWWRVTPRVIPLFARRFLPYVRWTGDVRHVARRGAAGWWQRHLRPADRARWQRTLRDLND
jgi:hypothetical protein